MWRSGGVPTVINFELSLSGPNGIVLSSDERYAYVAAFATGRVVRFDLSVDPIQSETVSLDILPDNIFSAASPALLTAGGNILGAWLVSC